MWVRGLVFYCLLSWGCFECVSLEGGFERVVGKDVGGVLVWLFDIFGCCSYLVFFKCSDWFCNLGGVFGSLVIKKFFVFIVLCYVVFGGKV